MIGLINIRGDKMNEEFNTPELDEIAEPYSSEDHYYAGEKEVKERLWEKVERTGKKISFIKDVLALFNYMSDRRVQWYRKSIVVGALVYFIMPMDMIPDIAPLVGYMDDLGVITAVLKYLGHELIPYYD